jgi:hypothetical protein
MSGPFIDIIKIFVASPKINIKRTITPQIGRNDTGLPILGVTNPKSTLMVILLCQEWRQIHFSELARRGVEHGHVFVSVQFEVNNDVTDDG